MWSAHVPRHIRKRPTNLLHARIQNHMQFAGPIASENEPFKLYIIGKTCKNSGKSCSSAYGLHIIDVSNGPTNTTGELLFTWPQFPTAQFPNMYGLRDAALGWDGEHDRLFWCLGDSQATSSVWGTCYTFKHGVDTEPQQWGKTGLGYELKWSNSMCRTCNLT
jgi:hypothetical protein